MSKIDSETKAVWWLIKSLLLSPITLLLVIFRKRALKDLFAPFSIFWKFFLQPRFTVTIFFLCIISFIVSVFLPERVLVQLVTQPEDLLSFRWYTFITAGFLHASIGHLVGNMLALLIFGRIVEMSYGAKKTALLYFGALVVSNIFASVMYIIQEQNPSAVGASGAIMGLLAVAVLSKPLYITYQIIIPIPVMVLGWLYLLADITGLLSTAESNIGHIAHLGGFLSITLLMYLLSPEQRKQLRKGLLINVFSVILFVVIVGIIGGS